MSAYAGHDYQLNQRVTALVENVFHFGAFVCLPDGTRAYIRKKELTQEGDVDPRQVISVGGQLRAVVIALPEKGQHLELSVRQAEPDPWLEFARDHRVQDTVLATVKKLLAGGVLAQIVPGVDGYIPLAELAPWQVDSPRDMLWVGDRVRAMITHLDPQGKRVTLSICRQIKHQASVGQVLDFLRAKEESQEPLADDQDETGAEEIERDLDPVLVERVGRILIVDDHEEVRTPLVKWLRGLGFAASGQASGEAALESREPERYGLALIDQDLSDRNSLRLIRALRTQSPGTWIAILSIPEWIAQHGDELAALGVVDVFVKPLHLEDVLDLLVRIGEHEPGDLRRWQAPEERREPPQGYLQPLAEAMRSGRPLRERFEAGLRVLVRDTRAEHGIVFYRDPDSQQMSVVAQVGKLALDLESAGSLNASPAGDVIREQMDVLENNVSASPGRFNKLLTLLSFESCMGVPIAAGGRTQHALFLFHREPGIFTHYRLRDTWAMATLFGAALEHEILEHRIQSVSPILLSGRLAAGFGHEVYNRMSGLEIQLRNLQTDCERLRSSAGSGQPMQADDLSGCHRAVEQLLDLALGLKETVELFRELMQAPPEDRINVNGVVQRTVELLYLLARRSRITIETELSDLPPISGSAIRLQQVFSNLMLNAIQHTAEKLAQWPEGRGELRITTTWEPERARPICVRFTDNGPGIHRQLWESIFGLGFSTRPGGTGLGLFIAQSLVASMGGQVLVEESTVPTGTTFRVELQDT